MEKESNRELVKQRLYIEHVIHCLKIRKILRQLYRNLRRRFGLSFNLIAGLSNSGLNFAIAYLLPKNLTSTLPIKQQNVFKKVT